MLHSELDSDHVNIRAMAQGELEQRVYRTQYMLAATSIASMSIIAVAALFMSLFF